MTALVWIGVVLIVLWVLGWLVFEVASLVIHVLLFVALALIAWGLLKKGARSLRR